jgi:hypothetical protein
VDESSSLTGRFQQRRIRCTEHRKGAFGENNLGTISMVYWSRQSNGVAPNRMRNPPNKKPAILEF